MPDFVQGRVSSTTRRLDNRSQGEHMLKVHQRNAVYARLLKKTTDKYEAEYQRNFNRIHQNILSIYFKDYLSLKVTKSLFPDIPHRHRSRVGGDVSSYHTKRSVVAPPRFSFLKFRSCDGRKSQHDPVMYNKWIHSLN